MFTEGKVTEFFFMADEFCKVFNRMMEKYAVEDQSRPSKRKYHRDSTLSDAEDMVIMILFHNSARHRSLHNFTVNLLSAIAAYCFFPKKPSISVVRVTDNQLTLL